MRRSVCGLVVGLALVVTAGPVQAAPQIVAALPTEGAIELACKDGTCAAELSAICLQQSRFTPVAGTSYDVYAPDRSAIAVIGHGEDGQQVSISPDALQIRSLRGQLAFRFSLPAANVAAHGVSRVTIAVRRLAVMLPRPVADDPMPQTVADVERTVREVGALGPYWADANAETLGVARMMTRVVNLLPAEGTLTATDADALGRQTLTKEGRAGSAAGLIGIDHVDHCRRRTEVSGTISMRRCIRNVHDQYMQGLNFGYYDAITPGS